MDTWWQSLNLPLQFFYGIGIAAGIALALEVCMTLLGFSHHELADGSLEHPDQLGVLSVRTITGFFFGFGWTGVIALKSGLTLLSAIVVAGVVGIAFLTSIYWLMRFLFSMRSSGTLDYKNAIGQVATVYVTVPPDRGGGGQVEVFIQGRLQTISCVTAHSTSLAPQSKVQVIGLVDRGTLDVQPLK